MADDVAEARDDLRAIAPTPASDGKSPSLGVYASSQPGLHMPYTCQTCAKRKVKCDKSTPICSSCRRGKLDCFYQAPPPRARKRKFDDDVLDKLVKYESILQQHGLLPAHVEATPSAGEPSPRELISLYWNDPETSRTGKLLADRGKSRYIDSNLWRNLGDDEIPPFSDDDGDDDDDEGDDAVASVHGSFAPDPLSGAFAGSSANLRRFHPTHDEAMVLWRTHVVNVEPLCKILHVPTVAKMVEAVSVRPDTASSVDECLLFAVYHFAVVSMSDDECTQKLGQPRARLMKRYHSATRQSLVNAAFLKTTEMAVLQALVLFLLSCRYTYDANTFWVLTGVAVRIGQRMGIHRDGEKLGLPPYEVQMRRRLFYQLLPLDGGASQMSGTGISMMPDAWDTQQPLNVDDEQIWPGMTEAPEERKGATEMIFCLSRSWVAKVFVAAGRPGSGSWRFNDAKEAERVIDETESEVEEKYIRYCDIVNPLHFLTVASARSGITAMRIRLRLPRLRNQTATDAERKELFRFAEKILDTDTAAYGHSGLQRYRWYVTSFFLWGTWDSLVVVLTTLWRRPDLLSLTDTAEAWNKVEQLYRNHRDLFESKRTPHVAMQRLTLKAWDAHRNSGVSEPFFVGTLRPLGRVNARSETEGGHGDTRAADSAAETPTLVEPSPAAGGGEPFTSNVSDGNSRDSGDGFLLDDGDWAFWDQLMQGYQPSDDQNVGFSQ